MPRCIRSVGVVAVAAAALTACNMQTGASPYGLQRVRVHVSVHATASRDADVVTTLVPGQIVRPRRQGAPRGWVAVDARGGIAGFVRRSDLWEVTFPSMAVALDSALTQDDHPARCVRPRLEPDHRYYLRERVFLTDSVVVDKGCWEADGSQSLLDVRWVKAPATSFTVLAPGAWACPELLDSLPEPVRDRLAREWLRLPGMCEGLTVGRVPDFFAGRATFQVGPRDLYALPDGFDEWEGALIVGDSAFRWESVVGGGAAYRSIGPFRVVRDTDAYRLVSYTWVTSDAPPFRRLDIFRTTTNPLRAELVLRREWSIERPDEIDPWTVEDDGSVRRRSGAVCTLDEARGGFQC